MVKVMTTTMTTTIVEYSTSSIDRERDSAGTLELCYSNFEMKDICMQFPISSMDRVNYYKILISHRLLTVTRIFHYFIYYLFRTVDSAFSILIFIPSLFVSWI